jgi:hypothetical protein
LYRKVGALVEEFGGERVVLGGGLGGVKSSSLSDGGMLSMPSSLASSLSAWLFGLFSKPSFSPNRSLSPACKSIKDGNERIVKLKRYDLLESACCLMSMVR